MYIYIRIHVYIYKYIYIYIYMNVLVFIYNKTGRKLSTWAKKCKQKSNKNGRWKMYRRREQQIRI